MTSVLDISMVQNNDKSIAVTVTDYLGNVINLTGCTIKWTVRAESYTPVLITKSTSTSNIILTDPVHGIFTIILVPSDTATMTPGTYYHEAVITDTGGKVSTLTDKFLMAGKLYLRVQYTQQ